MPSLQKFYKYNIHYTVEDWYGQQISILLQKNNKYKTDGPL